MVRFSAREAAKITGGIVSGDPARRARGIAIDSRLIRTGQAFVALPGQRFDGHDFVAEVLDRGAAFAIVEKGRRLPSMPERATVIAVHDTLAALGDLAAAWRARFKVKVAAVTGSIGKSTTKEMIAAVLSAKGRALKNEGNLNNLIGLPLTMFKLNAGHKYAVLEMGCNQPGEIARLTEIATPHAGLITRVAPAHLEGLGSIEGVANAKAEMIRRLSGQATFILNLDDRRVVSHTHRFKGRTIGFTAGRSKRFRGETVRLLWAEKDVVAGRPRVCFAVGREVGGKRTGRPVELWLPTLSRHNAINAVAAIAMGRAFGVSMAEAGERLKGFKPLSGRGEVVRGKRGVFVMDDTYNASPESVAGAIETLAWWKGPMRGVAALGEMMELGDYTEEYHRLAGRKVAEAGLELLVARGPHAKAMAKAAVRAGLPKDAAVVAGDNKEAAAILNKRLRKGDWVLVKGSRAMGMESVAKAIVG